MGHIFGLWDAITILKDFDYWVFVEDEVQRNLLVMNVFAIVFSLCFVKITACSKKKKENF